MRTMFKMTAIAAAVAAAGVAGTAQAETTVYGKAHLSLGNLTKATAATGDGLYVGTHASRLGVKASEDLGDGMKAFAQGEFEVDMVDGVKAGSSPFGARNNVVGLEGGFGKVVLGLHDMPYKMSIGKADVFGDTYADYNAVIASDTREDGVVIYSNKLGDLNLALAYSPNGGGSGANAATTGASVDFKFAPVDVSIAYESKASKTYTAARVGFDFGAGDAALVYASEDSKNNYYVSGQFKMSDTMKLKAAYGKEDGGTDALMAVGISNKMGKKAEVYALYGTGDISKAPVSAGGSALAVGVVYNF
jgi:predicted porin